MRRRLVLHVVIGSVLAVLVGSVSYVYYVLTRARAEVQHKRMQLFSQTDYRALLEACRGVSARLAAGELQPGRYGVRPDESARWLELPPIIMQLHPSFVDINEHGVVSINLGSFLDRFGVEAYPEDYEERSTHVAYGARQLAPGLWYWDADYVLNEEYRRRIDALIEQGRVKQGGEIE